MHDPGDEHRDPPPEPPREKDALTLLLEEFGDDGIVEMSEEAFQMMSYHEAMRDCCHHCALEANGEDGS